MGALIDLAETGLIPDRLIRAGIRRLLHQRLQQEAMHWTRDPNARHAELEQAMRRSPVALHTSKANEQHYELPAEFFRLMLGSRMKYSACLWGPEAQTLDQAEEAMLRLTCERAGIENGMSVLDLGCGWGSLSLWVAEHFPNSDVMAVSNSRLQREYIEAAGAQRGLVNLRATTADMNVFAPSSRYDRVVSVEMLEHMRNYPLLFSRIDDWLSPRGRLFVHVFCHRHYTYFYEADGNNDWMARYFFTGGTMPAADLLPRVQDALALAEHWQVNGRHYEKTLLAWLDRLDAGQEEALQILHHYYGQREARRSLMRWRLFLLACAELFGYQDGREWLVSHYLFEKRALRALAA